MLEQSLAEGLVAKGPVGFAQAKSKLENALSQPEASGCDLIAEALSALAAADLPGSEAGRRAGELMQLLPPELRTSDGFLQRIAPLQGAVKMGLVRALPSEALPGLYGKPRTAQPDPEACTTDAIAEVVSVSPDAGSDGSAVDRGATVLLVSAADNQAANTSILRANGYEAYRVANEDELDAHLGAPDICGFVVDGSAWEGLDAEGQRRILTKVAEYSSVAYTVVDTTRYHDPAEVHAIVEVSRLRQPTAKQFQQRGTSVLTEADLPCFAASAMLLSELNRPSLVPGDLDEAELRTAMLTVRAYFAEEYHPTGQLPGHVTYARMHGGKSPAKLMLIRFDDAGIPIVLKVGAKNLIAEEVKRFRQYISRFDNHLRPYAQFHGNTGAVAYGLVDAVAHPAKPAPTLEDKLQELWRREIWPLGEPIDVHCGELKTTIEATCRKLRTLNSQTCPDSPDPSYAYLRGSALQHLARSGVDWRFDGLTYAEIEAAIGRCHARTDTNGRMAIVHGDLHLMNVLVRGGADAYLIDYAYSGPGHPAYDLVRFECSLAFRFLRCTGPEAEFADMQRMISRDCADVDQVRGAFPTWWSSAINEVLLSGAIYARDCCFEVLKVHGLGLADYLATKFLVSCWSMSIPILQMSPVRGTILGLAQAV